MRKQVHSKAITIHRSLWNPPRSSTHTGPDGLGIADSRHPDGRDKALKDALKLRLGVSSFHARNLAAKSAQDYMSAFLETLAPLAAMYKDICDYAQRTNLRRSKQSQALEWDFTVGGITVELNLEHFRRYQAMVDEFPDEREFRAFWQRFREAVCEASTWGKGAPARSEDDFAPGPAARPELLAIHDAMGAIWSLPDKERHERFPEAMEIWFLFGRLKQDPPSLQSPLFEGMSVPVLSHARLAPEDILDLPFWKYRWQVYEIWATVTALAALEPLGFSLTFAPGGQSMLAQGAACLLAIREQFPAAYAYAQPSYVNSKGETVHPDLVISSSPDMGSLDASNVVLIVEVKQRKRSAHHEWARKQHFEEALERYAAATAAGDVILLNYDDLPDRLAAPARALAWPDFHPGPGYDPTLLPAAIVRCLPACAGGAAAEAQDLVVFDHSGSMTQVFTKAASELRKYLERFGDSALLYATVDDCFYPATEWEVLHHRMPPKFTGTENGETLAKGVNALVAARPIRQMVFITDLGPDPLADFMADYAQAGGTPRLRVVSVRDAARA